MIRRSHPRLRHSGRGLGDHTRVGLAIVAAALVAAAVTSRVSFADVPFNRSDTFAALESASLDTGVPYVQLYRVVACETGGTFNPYAEGDSGHSHGVAQLNDFGNALAAFYAVGYTNPYNPYEAVYFMAESLRGDHAPLGPHTWSCR